MDKTILNKTHQRLLGSLLFVLEQKTEQIEHIIKHSKENASYYVESDLNEKETSYLLNKCLELKEKITEISLKFNLPKRKINLYHYVSTTQSQMWEHISDAFSDKLRGYGEQLKTNAKIVDPDIKELSEIIDKMNF